MRKHERALPPKLCQAVQKYHYIIGIWKACGKLGGGGVGNALSGGGLSLGQVPPPPPLLVTEGIDAKVT
jgi:hypothetical protein